MPRRSINLIGALIVGIGLFPTSVQPPIEEPVTAPPTGPTVEYGEYQVRISACRDCHGQELTGGQPGGFHPAGPNLIASANQWSAEEFLSFMRTGVDPKTGRQVDPDLMPWPDYAGFNDEEIMAMHAYLQSLDVG